MPKNQQKQRVYARRLRELSENEKGRICNERVGAILATLRANPPKEFRSILKIYLAYIARALRKEHVTIEHAGEVSEKSVKEIKDFLDNYYKRDVRVTHKEKPELIAGVVVRSGDDIWDASIAGYLETLSKTI